jgi:hypothetical protein
VLPPDEATALALLANGESNQCLQACFPERLLGKVTVDLRRAPENEMILQITDSGVGMHLGSRRTASA